MKKINLKQGGLFHVLWLALLLFYSSLVFAADSDTIAANNALIEYTGRIDFTDSLTPEFSYSGVSIRACFTGTSIGVILSDNVGQNYYHAIIDGTVMDKFLVSTSQQTYMLAEGLENTTHEVELFKRTELQFGKTQFHGFVVDAGETLVQIQNQRTHFIEYIGNSITCGYGNEGVNGGTFGPTTENHYTTYAAITSRNFNARHMAVSRSGIGVYHNYGAPASGSQDCMSNNFTRIFLYDATPLYDFAVTPDVVCINLGTNDFSEGLGDSALFVSNYLRLIDTIQTKYNQPQIICLLGPMLSGSYLTEVRSYLKFIADSANNKGKGNVSFFEMSAQTGDLGIGIDYHPTVAQHQRNAKELSNYIQSVKGWSITPDLTNIEISTAKAIELEFNTPIQDESGHFAGFSISGADSNYEIDSIYTDADDQSFLHIVLKDVLKAGDTITMKYVPGTVESVSGAALNEISGVGIENDLTETSIQKAYNTSDGLMVILKFNKSITDTSTFEGLTFYSRAKEYTIDTFTISSTIGTFTINEPVYSGDSLFLSYSGSNVVGKDEVVMQPFTDLVVTNNSNYNDIKVAEGQSFTIYPNPSTSGKINYQFSTNFSGMAVMKVLNTKGQLVLTTPVSQEKGSFDLGPGIEKGVYFIQVSSQKNEWVQTLVIN